MRVGRVAVTGRVRDTNVADFLGFSRETALRRHSPKYCFKKY